MTAKWSALWALPVKQRRAAIDAARNTPATPRTRSKGVPSRQAARYKKGGASTGT